MEISKPCRCGKCGKTIQFARVNGRWTPVEPKMICFTPSFYGVAEAVNEDGVIVKAYIGDGGSEKGWRLHNAATSCFTFPWEEKTNDTVQ